MILVRNQSIKGHSEIWYRDFIEFRGSGVKKEQAGECKPQASDSRYESIQRNYHYRKWQRKIEVPWIKKPLPCADHTIKKVRK